MLMIMLFFSILMYFMGLISFCMKRKYFLLMLLSLEFIILSLFMNLFIYLSVYGYEYYLSMIFITMSVCEGALGLSILVSMIRSHGNDYFQLFNLLW
uniref:NADH-ubiquinone oxidoreductase chain 4L n=1 Tax=Megalinus hunanensis TaxID=2820342 RepID=A0A8A4YML9_9COLE|nr:NADH dehydrogenase subunit 4L [Megalinus hunanensis]QTE20689.1 NADH dehydrogenase subunit 4L [Megalinus hunanensis]